MRHGPIDQATARGLRVLRDRIDAAGIPSSRLDENIILATWNIREFGRKARLEPSIHFIAEILGQFDLIAITEVRDDLSDLDRVVAILGPYWRVVFSDFIADRGGNRERVAYLYDERAVTFTGLAAEADPPRRKNAAGEYVAQIDWWRAPYIASFQAGDFDFVLLTVHIRWGAGSAARVGPLKTLAEWVTKRRKDRHSVDQDIIVMGDFNIPDTDDATFGAIISGGLRIPKALRGVHGSNLAGNKRYDQILHFPRYTKCFTDRGGVLDFFAGDHGKLFPADTLTKREFTYELSDHLPLWIEVDVDTSEEQLDQILGV